MLCLQKWLSNSRKYSMKHISLSNLRTRKRFFLLLGQDFLLHLFFEKLQKDAFTLQKVAFANQVHIILLQRTITISIFNKAHEVR